MEAHTIMKLIQAYFAARKPPVDTTGLSTRPVTELLQDSLDVVEFLVYLEEQLKLDSEIDASQFGPSLMNRNFGELAGEIARLLTAWGR